MRFRSLIYFFLIFCIILFAAGCGEGGSSSNDVPAGDNGDAGNGNENDNDVIQPGPWLCFTANKAGSTVTTVISYGTVTHTPSLEYSYDGEAWSPFALNTGDPEADTKVTLANVGDKVYLRATGKNDSFSEPDESGIVSFAMTGSIAASGNVMSLVDKDCTATEIPSDYCFESLFEDCTVLTAAPELPATTLAEGCYNSMFYGCTDLTTAPVLPATVLADCCYSYMFDGCSSLTSAPDLPATTLANECYAYMFSGCTGITSAPALPVTTLVDRCYESMFYGCSGLTSAPDLPATTLANMCYSYMFTDCTGITSAPTLPVTTLADGCYRGMFSGCRSLTSAPALPATTLANECYLNMFGNCSELTTAPELPAEVLKENCYKEMFLGCKKLNSITVHFISWSPYNATTDWVIGVKNTGIFYCPSELVGGNPADPGNFDNSKVHAGWTISILP